MEQNAQRTEKYKDIGGWFILPIIGQAYNLIMMLKVLPIYAHRFVLRQIPIASILTVLIILGMIAFFLLIELRCGAFRHVFVGYMAAIVVVSLVVGDYARVGAGSMIGEIIASVIGVSLWTKYFFASERVAAYLNYTPQNRRLDCGLACDEPAPKREETLGEKLFGEGLAQGRERRKLNTGNIVSIVIAAAMAVAVVLAAGLFY